MEICIIIFILVVLLSIIVFLIADSTIQKRYNNFVLQNSIYLKKLLKINDRYKFYSHVNYNQSHTYDNDIFFNDISCLDYLIYQLQFISGKVIDQINKEKKNEQLYAEYLDEIGALTEMGEFLIDAQEFNYKKLLAIENRLIKQYTYQQPSTNFSITVTLYLSNINGRIYAKKDVIYYADDIIDLIKRMKNRNGNFYADRGVWDSICKVERGKVSNKMRFSIYNRDGYRCCRCGVSQRYAYLEIDHIIPIAKGGKSMYNNLQTLCRRCNVEKGDRLDF